MKKLFYFSIAFIGLLICPNSFVNAQGLGVNTTGAPADNSAGLDVSNSSQGALLPRMSTSQRDAISSPATGLTIFNTDCGLYNYNAGTPGSPNWAIVNSPNALIAGVSISSNPPVVCGGSSVTFTATPAAGLSSPSYQWQVNGSNVGTGTTYTTSGLNTADIVTCVLSTTQACVTGSPATSNAIVIPNSVPAAPSTITPPAVACQDSLSGNVYTASLVPGATQYNWVLPVGGHAFITSGIGTNALSLGFNDTVGNIGSLTVTASNACGVSAATTSAPIILSHKTPATPGAISGIVHSFINATNIPYSISAVTYATTYFWSTPGGSVSGGQGTTNSSINWGNTTGTFYVYVKSGNSCGVSGADSLAVDLCTYTPGTQTFTYTGSTVTWTAPCATSLTITAVGAMGGNASTYVGLGGTATGTLTITPGETLYINVGQQGGTPNPYTGGWNGGGGGGTQNIYNVDSGFYAYGYGGGGASDVRVGGTALSNRVIVGGGGGGTAKFGSRAGGGGGTTGGNATLSEILNETYSYYNGYTYSYQYFVFYMTGGSGGTQSGGGAAGACASNSCPESAGYGAAGTSGQGGGSDGYCNGGGGGGYWGGGSGSTSFYSSQNWYSSSSGGGGSSYVGSLSAASTTGNTNGPSSTYSGNGYVTFTW